MPLHDTGEVILDGRVDIRDVERDSEPAGKCVKVTQIDFPLPRHFQLPLEAGRELAHRHCNEYEQDQVDDFLRFLDAEAVGGRVEEKGGRKHAAHGGDQRRHNPPTCRRDHNRDQVGDGTMRKPAFPHEQK